MVLNLIPVDIQEFVCWAEPLLRTSFWSDALTSGARGHADDARLGPFWSLHWEDVRGMANRVWSAWADHVRLSVEQGGRNVDRELSFEHHACCLLTVCFLLFLRKLERNGWRYQGGPNAGGRGLYLPVYRQNWRDAVQYCLYERWIALDARQYGFGHAQRPEGDQSWRDRRSFLRSIESQQVFANVLRDFVYKFEGRASEHGAVVVPLDGECPEPRIHRGFTEAAARDEIQSLYRCILRSIPDTELRQRALWVARSFLTPDLAGFVGRERTGRLPAARDRLAWIRRHDRRRSWHAGDLRRVDPVFRRLALRWYEQISAAHVEGEACSDRSLDATVPGHRMLRAG
jgi:hypothetical protein